MKTVAENLQKAVQNNYITTQEKMAFFTCILNWLHHYPHFELFRLLHKRNVA